MAIDPGLPGLAHPSPQVIAEPAAKDRLFLGIFPDATAQLTIGNVAHGYLRDQALRATPQHPSRLHVTVHHLGDHAELGPETVDAALAAMAQIKSPPWTMVLDRITGFPGESRHYPIVLHCASPGVHALWRESRGLFEAAGFSRWLEPGFSPHLTLFHADRLPPAPIPIRPILWPVREVALVHSLLGRNTYCILGTRQLPNA